VLSTVYHGAGIGFTVALFVATVAFDPGPLQDASKMGALASALAAAIALVAARLLARCEEDTVMTGLGIDARQKGMVTFCRPFTKAEIRYFEYSHADDARTWLQQKPAKV